jgi:hypothetical protein
MFGFGNEIFDIIDVYANAVSVGKSAPRMHVGFP